MRLLALLLLLAVLPTAEVTEQAIHLIEHAVHGDEPDHLAHHDDTHGDEHGCTGLMHLCGCHYTQITFALDVVSTRAVETLESVTAGLPPVLIDLNSLEPPHRPPIA